MKKNKHRRKDYDRMLSYDFDLHRWVYDVKFYLINEHWHISPDGGTIVGDLRPEQETKILKYQSEADELERKYQTDDQRQICRKRTCPCKDCETVYKCDNGCFECIRKGITVNVGFCTEHKINA